MVDVPFLPGVPALSSYSTNPVVLLIADLVSAVLAFFGSPWGIFLNGVQAFDYSSIVDVEFKQDFPISDYQLEDGGFQSYDKVQLPFDVKVRVASFGDEAGREQLLADVDAAANSLNLYDVVTPEKTYFNCNITHHDYKRSSTNGVGMIVVDIWFVEIRITATSTFTGTQQPGVSQQQNTGNVATTQPNAQTQELVSDGVT